MSNRNYKKKSIDNWVIEQVVILDWHDGPLSGFCALKTPRLEFYFNAIAEKSDEDDLDDRLYSVCSVNSGTMKYLLEQLTILGSPVNNTWIPVWQHENKKLLEKLDSVIKTEIKNAKPNNYVILSNDFKSFKGSWEIYQPFESIDNWFEFLNPE